MNMQEKKNTIGIVLEGGALRGMYTAGVLDVMMKNGISADKMVGVSAGALFGVNFVSGQIGRAIRYNKKFNSDRNYMGLIPLIKEGNIVSTEYAYDRVPKKLDPFDNKAFQESETEFYAVVTNISTGKPEYILVEDVFKQMDVLRASGSMPFVSKPVHIGGNDYLDGAIGDSIPFEWMEKQGVDKIIVIVTQDLTYRKKQMQSFLTDRYLKTFPEIAKGLANRHALYNRQIAWLRDREKKGQLFVIRPSQRIEIGRVEKDPDKLQAVYDLGQKDAQNRLEALKQYLELI